MVKKDWRPRIGRKQPFEWVWGFDLAERSLQEGEYLTTVDRDEDQLEKALLVRRTACLHVAGVGLLVLKRLVDGPAESVQVIMCGVNLLCLQVN